MKGRFYIKEISKQEIQKLLDAGIIRNTHLGYVNQKGNDVGYYRTSGAGHKRYIDIYRIIIFKHKFVELTL